MLRRREAGRGRHVKGCRHIVEVSCCAVLLASAPDHLLNRHSAPQSPQRHLLYPERGRQGAQRSCRSRSAALPARSVRTGWPTLPSAAVAARSVLLGTRRTKHDWRLHRACRRDCWYGVLEGWPTGVQFISTQYNIRQTMREVRKIDICTDKGDHDL